MLGGAWALGALGHAYLTSRPSRLKSFKRSLSIIKYPKVLYKQ